MACWDGFGNLADGRPLFTGQFRTGKPQEVLFHNRVDGNWWCSGFNGAMFEWRLCGNTPNWLGNSVRRVWVDFFSGTPQPRAELLFYYPDGFSPHERRFKLGQWKSDTELDFQEVGATAGFGGYLHSSRYIWHGHFSADDAGRQLLVYIPETFDWWLGWFEGGLLKWKRAGNTVGFGQLADGRPFWTGEFRKFESESILFYYPGDRNWWLGTVNSNRDLHWSLVGNSSDLGQIWDGRPFWVGDFNNDFHDDILFYNPEDNNWGRGTFVGEKLEFKPAGDTSGFGQVGDGRPIWTGWFTGQDKGKSILFYFPNDHNWWLGSFIGPKIEWIPVGNTIGFGDLTKGNRKLFVGRFSDLKRTDVMFYYPTDGRWWLGSIHNGSLGWHEVSNTGRSYSQKLRVHIKILQVPDVPIETSVANLRLLLAPLDIRVDLVSTEYLSIPELEDVDVGGCLGLLTDEHLRLFGNRNFVVGDDIVIYFVRTVLARVDGRNTTVNGCAAFPLFRPGAVCSQGSSQWTMAHEIGHVLGLPHYDDDQCVPSYVPTGLMTGCGTARLRGRPTLSQFEQNVIKDNMLTLPC